MGGTRARKVKVNQKEIVEDSSRGVSLGTVFSTAGFSAHMTNRIAIAKKTLPQLFSLRNLSTDR